MPAVKQRELIPIDEAARYLAPVCLAIAEQHAHTRGALRSHLKITLKWLIRDMERYVRPRVSARALKTASDMGLGDLRQMQWRDQPRRMNDPRRKIFHWEHVTRVADIADAILALKPPTAPEIETIISGIVVAWILKTEDDLLPPGVRADPLEIYRSVGIDLID